MYILLVRFVILSRACGVFAGKERRECPAANSKLLGDLWARLGQRPAWHPVSTRVTWTLTLYSLRMQVPNYILQDFLVCSDHLRTCQVKEVSIYPASEDECGLQENNLPVLIHFGHLLSSRNLAAVRDVLKNTRQDISIPTSNLYIWRHSGRRTAERIQSRTPNNQTLDSSEVEVGLTTSSSSAWQTKVIATKLA
jgi:hypothetical protein